MNDMKDSTSYGYFKVTIAIALAFIVISLTGAFLVLISSVSETDTLYIDVYFGENSMSPIFFGICAIVGAYLLINSKPKK